MRILNIKKLFLFSSIIAVMFTACSKDEKDETSIKKETISTVPFFELAKGDSVPKSVWREKPVFADTSAKILFSTENEFKVKSSGNTGSGTSIKYLYISNRRSNNVGDCMPVTTYNGITHYAFKIPVDLNEGAGGRWIYLFYSRDGFFGADITWIDAANGYAPAGQSCVQDASGDADVNDGAGGEFVYIVYTRNQLYNWWNGSTPVREIMIVSSNSGNTAINGWIMCGKDLNAGAGGKYINLYYKRY